MKITAIRSSTNAVGEYRVRHPMLALRDLGHDTHVITLDRHGEVRISNEELIGDILVLARLTSPAVFDLLDTLPADLRPRTVYEVDDDPWEWHSWDPVHRQLGAGYAKAVTDVMSRCDAITCSTRTLAARIRTEMPGKPIWVIPNAIDYQFRDWTKREDRNEYGLHDRVVLGWTGSIHHQEDISVMLQAMPEILSDYPSTVLLMQCDPAAYSGKLKCLTKGPLSAQIRWSPPVSFDIHPGIYSLFDINLAPLSVTPFNLCKSDLRLIEGGAQGVPYVATKIAPYAILHEETGGIGGYLAETPMEWVDALENLIDGEREARGQSLARYVREARSLSVSVGQWQAAYQSILAEGKGQEVQPIVVPGRNDRCPCGSGVKYKRCCIPAYG